MIWTHPSSSYTCRLWKLCMYGLSTKCEVKVAGYWPSSFFGVFMDRDRVEVRGQYLWVAILTEQAWSRKDLLYGFWEIFFAKRGRYPRVARFMGYWPSVRSRWLDIGQGLFCVFMHWDEVEAHKLAKKRTRPIFSHFDRTKLVNKGFITWLSLKFSLRDTEGTPGSPERARWLHLACSRS